MHARAIFIGLQHIWSHKTRNSSSSIADQRPAVRSFVRSCTEVMTAPDFKRDHSTELLQQRALEKEREREASQNVHPGTIHCMQFAFSIDQPASFVATAVS